MILPPDERTISMTDHTDVCAPVGKLEMADMFGVKHATVHQWQFRNSLPPADHAAVNGSEAWDRSTLLVWGMRRGKNLSDGDRAEAQRLIDAEDA